jgi:uncharacterized phage protein (TIGR02220 family)
VRIRTIKPEFFLHEALFEAERAHKLPLRIAFAGLWCAADREGRFKWEPRRLGVQILPYDGADFSRVLDALTTRGFILKYASGTGEFGVIPSFKGHQVINNRERESELPEPTEPVVNQDIDACPTRAPRDDDGNADTKSGKEGKGREQGREQGRDMSGTPDVAPLPAKVKRFEEEKPILQLLVELTGRGFRETDSNLGLISSRMAEKGVSAEGMKLMVQRQVAMWKTDPMMSEFLRPETLFGKQKFDGYYAARELPINHDSNHAGPRGQRPAQPHRNDTISGSDEFRRQWALQPDESPGECPHPLE